MSQSVCAQTSPYPMDVEAGKKYAWCACGRSATQPLCDGSHKGTGMNPLIVTADEAGTVYFCGCKQTARPPFCDGTHSRLAPTPPVR
ncbi:MAG: CDGSH iron-sulfur domain-containing protein [Rhodospirillales bacterium]|nr:CDGSH iron-sulfur domain-containing protein [Rhodospirillales bacterium]